MMKLRRDKNNDRKLLYRTLLCDVCRSQLFRTIEKQNYEYISPSIIIVCDKCQTTYCAKFSEEGFGFELVSIKK